MLFLGFAGAVECLQAANSRATDKMCGRWLMLIIYLIILFFLSSTDAVLELNSSIASDRGSINIFAPSVNNAVTCA